MQGTGVIAEKSAQELAEKCAEQMLIEDTACQTLGITLDEISPGRALLSITVRPGMLNGHTTCHGGHIFLLADSAFALACNSRNQRTVAASADISFVRTAHEGETLHALAQERWREGRNGIYDVTVTNEKGETIAEFRGKSRTVTGSILNHEEGAS